MTEVDLQSRLLAAIAEVEQREGIKVQLGLTEPSLLLSLCQAHREILEYYQLTREALDRDADGPDRDVHFGAGAALSGAITALARAYGLNPEEQP